MTVKTIDRIRVCVSHVSRHRGSAPADQRPSPAGDSAKAGMFCVDRPWGFSVVIIKVSSSSL